MNSTNDNLIYPHPSRWKARIQGAIIGVTILSMVMLVVLFGPFTLSVNHSCLFLAVGIGAGAIVGTFVAERRGVSFAALWAAITGLVLGAVITILIVLLGI